MSGRSSKIPKHTSTLRGLRVVSDHSAEPIYVDVRITRPAFLFRLLTGGWLA